MNEYVCMNVCKYVCVFMDGWMHTCIYVNIQSNIGYHKPVCILNIKQILHLSCIYHDA